MNNKTTRKPVLRKSTEIVAQYLNGLKFLESIYDLLFRFIKDMLKGRADIHLIKGRVKSKKSFLDKILNKNKIYENLWDVTDLIGFRVVTYFDSDLPPLLKLLNKHFRTDKEQSVDKIKMLKPDQVGYLSIHRILFLPDEIAKVILTPWAAHFRFELQLRTYLQNAWDHNSRGLDYDNPVILTPSLKRKLYRIAALLELADIQFSEIKKEVEQFNKKVLRNVDCEKYVIPINEVSLKRFVQKDQVIISIEKKISEALNVDLVMSKGFIELVPFNLKWLGFSRLNQLRVYLEDHRNEVCDFAVKRLAHHQILPQGISVWYMCYHKVCSTSKEELKKYIEENGIDFLPEFHSPADLTDSLYQDFEMISNSK